MDILAKARKLESTLARTFDRAAQHWSASGPRGPLEVLHAILDEVEARVEPAGRGTRLFPFNKIKVSIVAPTRDVRARFAGVLDDPPLEQRIGDRLRQRGCDVPEIHVRIVYVAQPETGWLAPDCHINFSRVAQSDLPASEPTSAHEIRLTVTRGAADKPSYVLTLDRINLGRCAEVRDSRNRLIRTNHVVFKDGEDAVNDTVSRHHAHIERLDDTREFRLSDDRSAHGTSVARNGKTIPVPSGSRGVRLQSGDEISLGEARLRVRIADSG
jgi:hypothetical protein